jgi:hypothetical protein
MENGAAPPTPGSPGLSSPPAKRANSNKIANVPFQRVKVEEVQHLLVGGDARIVDNSYASTFGGSGWGAKASEVLSRVRGKDFRHEKTKKKRGSYRGGAIDTNAVNSYKFKDSDDDE